MAHGGGFDPMAMRVLRGGATMAPRQTPKGGNRVKDIRVQVNDEEKSVLVAAAARRHLDTSTWLRSLGLAEADRDVAPAPRTVRRRRSS